MAISSYKVFLMHGTTSQGTTTYAKLVDIKDFPALGETPNMLDTTTLSNRSETFIMGIIKGGALEFTCNYDKTDYETIKDLEGTTEKFALWFGGTEDGATLTPTGSEGKWNFDGQITVFPDGGSVDEVVNMKVVIARSSDIEYVEN